MVDLPPDIDSVEPIGKTSPLESSDQEPMGSQKSFAEYMQSGGPSQASAPSAVQTATQNPTSLQAPTMDSMNAQMDQAKNSIQTVQDQLGTSNLRLKAYQKYAVGDHLKKANGKIRDAAEKLGVDTGPAPEKIGRNSPAVQFLSFLTDGTAQLNAAKNHIAALNKQGKSMRPGEMLLIQVKLSRAQQEIEYASTILSNAISSIKSLFNTQI